MVMPFKDAAQHVDDIHIRTFRNRWRLSQNDLARILGVSRTMIQRVETEGAFIPRLFEIAFLKIKEDAELKEDMAQADKEDAIMLAKRNAKP